MSVETVQVHWPLSTNQRKQWLDFYRSSGPIVFGCLRRIVYTSNDLSRWISLEGKIIYFSAKWISDLINVILFFGLKYNSVRNSTSAARRIKRYCDYRNKVTAYPIYDRFNVTTPFAIK